MRQLWKSPKSECSDFRHLLYTYSIAGGRLLYRLWSCHPSVEWAVGNLENYFVLVNNQANSSLTTTNAVPFSSPLLRDFPVVPKTKKEPLKIIHLEIQGDPLPYILGFSEPIRYKNVFLSCYNIQKASYHPATDLCYDYGQL